MPTSSRLRNVFRSSAAKKKLREQERYERMMKENEPIYLAWKAEQEKQKEENKEALIETLLNTDPQRVVDWRKNKEAEEDAIIRRAAEAATKKEKNRLEWIENEAKEYSALLARNEAAEAARIEKKREALERKLALYLYDQTSRGQADARERSERIGFILENPDFGGGRRKTKRSKTRRGKKTRRSKTKRSNNKRSKTRRSNNKR